MTYYLIFSFTYMYFTCLYMYSSRDDLNLPGKQNANPHYMYDKIMFVFKIRYPRKKPTLKGSLDLNRELLTQRN